MSGAEAIIEAIKEGSEEEVKRLLSEDPGLAKARGAKGESLVLMAVYRGRADLAQLLVEAGAQTDFFEACATGHLERVKALLAERPGDVNAFAPDGFTPLGLASFFGHLAVARHLVANGAQVNLASGNDFSVMPLHSAAAGRHTAIVKLLLESAAHVDAKQRSGFTALHSAAHNGQLDVVELLLAYGASLNERSEEGLTPLKLAEDRGHAVVAGLLRARGATL